MAHGTRAVQELKRDEIGEHLLGAQDVVAAPPAGARG
jgi:hypothetical protein